MSQESLGDIFVEEGLLQWILDYLLIAVSRQDRISQAICDICRIQLAEFHRFRIRCQDVQSVLQSMILARSNDGQQVTRDGTQVVIKTEPKTWESFRAVCRLCMGVESLGCIFKQEGLHQLILDYLMIVVSREDGISQAICALCRLQLTEFHQFRIRCQDVQNVLHSMMLGEDECEELVQPISSCSKLEYEPSFGLDLVAGGKELGTEPMIEKCDRLEPTMKNIPEQEQSKCFVEEPMPIEHVNLKSEPPEEDNSCSDEQEYETEMQSAMVQIPLDIIQKHERRTPTTIIYETEQPNEPQDAIVIEEVKVEPHEKEDAPIPKVQQFPCNLCERVCTSKNKLKRHKQIVHGPRVHACEICNFKASLHRDLRKHLRTKQHFNKLHASLGNDAFTVSVGSKNESETADKPNVKVENDQSIGKEDGDTCTTEEASPERKVPIGDESLQTTEGHNDEKQLQCDICHKMFAMDRKKLLDHKWYVHGYNEYECPICGRPFSLRHRMLDHIRTHDGPRHRGKRKDQDHLAKPFKCEVCEMEFRLKKTFNYHRRQKHGLTEVVCNICGKPFAYPYQLKEHMDQNDHNRVARRQQGVKRSETDSEDLDIRFKCAICQKLFKREGSLYAHQKMKHEEKPHVCSVCDKPYAFQCQLKVHMKSHENPRKRKIRAEKSEVVIRVEGDGPLTRARSSKIQTEECGQAEDESSVE